MDNIDGVDIGEVFNLEKVDCVLNVCNRDQLELLPIPLGFNGWFEENDANWPPYRVWCIRKLFCYYFCRYCLRQLFNEMFTCIAVWS